MSTSDSPPESSLTRALRHFEATEANLSKLERVWKEIVPYLPTGPAFGSPPEYEEKVRIYTDLLSHLPTIDGWKPTAVPMDLNELGQWHLDALEIGELSATVAADEAAHLPAKELAEYRFRLNKQRRVLVRSALAELVDHVDHEVRTVERIFGTEAEATADWNAIAERIRDDVSQMDTLLGSSIKRPGRWADLRRHLRFAEPHDFRDIVRSDWPSVQKGLQQAVYEDDEPIPVEVEDLAVLTKSKPKGPVSQKLRWNKLSPEEFERLIFMLISTEDGYENAQWLTPTNAPDRGRDLSVNRVTRDGLTGTIRNRVIIQCKHWLTKSISPTEIATLKEQIKLWEPPRVDVLIIATSGRFSSDAVASIEKHGQSDSGLRIEMWPESHLETLLASRPHFIAEFALR
jgi:hypothetical protein